MNIFLLAEGNYLSSNKTANLFLKGFKKSVNFRFVLKYEEK
jgi:hypothetical protein